MRTWECDQSVCHQPHGVVSDSQFPFDADDSSTATNDDDRFIVLYTVEETDK